MKINERMAQGPFFSQSLLLVKRYLGGTSRKVFIHNLDCKLWDVENIQWLVNHKNNLANMNDV